MSKHIKADLYQAVRTKGEYVAKKGELLREGMLVSKKYFDKINDNVRFGGKLFVEVEEKKKAGRPAKKEQTND